MSLTTTSLSFASRPITCSRRLPPFRQIFSTSWRQEDHYKTLGLPHGASKAQIKSHFYRLSKRHHPDVSKDPKSREIFHSVSEAYSVLNNDRERRAYDRSLLHRAPPTPSPYPYSPRSPSSKGPRASYAWEYSNRARGFAQRKPPPAPDYDYGGAYRRTQSSQDSPPGQGRPYTPPSYHDVLTGERRRLEDREREMDRVRNESTVYRAIQLISFLALSFAIFGGMKSHS
ncbi:uncharacterized protein LACBIDRAFT_315431 [Laccaria bicolor S238N-H82]|uniref:Predicted protein n=1 Tax=Laccaria bicolor (strain S238N-H82 / ATCC MYA-4686) TaxID=486041 RepID=B0D2D2_LACBS|nr:uncharacterized protein LACBIDRAFT_315431 [Laccaria bicolor S238N-H82]EDR10725.1 predicted protein [Laccaria bicolor S238N-H82]|eukprot:XP_001878026.1 predicted protein [Laccaria bicolor S238N-H82]